MWRDALDVLACPRCGASLRPERPVEEDGELLSGRLACTGGCGNYPIEAGVPRLLPELVGAPLAGDDGQAATARSFGSQWELFAYGGTTWGVTLEERLPVVLHELEWTAKDLPGKVILDAGCGNGTLSQALAESGATVVAADLSDSVFRAHARCRADGLHFVQGNLFYPPFKRRAFDAVYSCGVFHHTPDTRRCFRAVVPMLRRRSGSRFFVWLYSRRSALFNATVEPLMKLTCRLPGVLLVPLCRALAPFVEGSSRLLTRAGVLEYAPRTLRDRTIQLHDLLSPRYVWYHDFEEARAWAGEAGFEQIQRTPYEVDGRAVAGLRAILHKYRTVCRPGFGMLCTGPRGGAPRSAP